MLDNMWYYNKKGKAFGPVDTDVIEKMVSGGELGHLDLVFHEGESEWLPVNSVPEFKKALDGFQINTQQPDKSGIHNWVVLKAISTPDGLQYEQKGPFTEEQVIELVEKGEFKFSDYVWKPGFQAWRRVREIPEFGEPLPSTPNIDKELYETKARKGGIILEPSQLSKLIEIDFDPEPVGQPAPQYFDPDPIPKEVKGEDLVADDLPKADVSLQGLQVPGVAPAKAGSIVTAPESTKIHTKTLTSTSTEVTHVPEVPHTEGAIEGPTKLSDLNVPVIESTDQVDLKPSNGPIWYVAAALLLVCGAAVMLFVNARTQNINEKPLVQNTISKKDTLFVKPKVVAKKSRSKLKKKTPVLRAKKTKTKKRTTRVRSKAKKGALSALRTKKKRAYYKQRDRKALLYSSLKVSRLAAELDQSSKRLASQPRQWRTFYTGWKVKLKKAVSPTIKVYSKSKVGDYALPKSMAGFKKSLTELKGLGTKINLNIIRGKSPKAGAGGLSKQFYGKYKRVQSL